METHNLAFAGEVRKVRSAKSSVAPQYRREVLEVYAEVGLSSIRISGTLRSLYLSPKYVTVGSLAEYHLAREPVGVKPVVFVEVL